MKAMFLFRTHTYMSRRAVDGQLQVFINSGEDALPVMLAWTDQKGNNVSINFHDGMEGFIGYHQRSRSWAYEGNLIHKQEISQIDQKSMQSGGYQDEKRVLVGGHQDESVNKNIFMYRTEHCWGPYGSPWHRASPLAFSIDNGEKSLLANLTWRDQKHYTGSIGFTKDMERFFGYYRKVAEGPIRYQGVLTRSVRFPGL